MSKNRCCRTYHSKAPYKPLMGSNLPSLSCIRRKKRKNRFSLITVF
jgi:hypothetical protein